MRFAAPLIATVLLGCAGVGGIGSINKTNHLRPGMTTSEVQELLGEPGQSEYVEGYLVWRYSLHQVGRGWVPFYLAFEGRTAQLASWQASVEEYYATQSLWIEALPKQHHVNVDGQVEHQGTIEHRVDGEIRVR